MAKQTVQYAATQSAESQFTAPGAINGPGDWATFEPSAVEVLILKVGGQGVGDFDVTLAASGAQGATKWQVLINNVPQGPVRTGNGAWTDSFSNPSATHETVTVQVQWQGGGLAKNGTGSAQVSGSDWIPGGGS